MINSTVRSLAALMVVVAGLWIGIPSAQAATDTWEGNASALFSGANWIGGNNPPLSGDSLVFGVMGSAGASLTADQTAGISYAGITFNSGASAFTIGGANGITLTGNIANNGTSLETMNFNIASTNVRTFTTTDGGGDITLGGAYSGTGGGIIKAGRGVLTLSGSDSATGANTIQQGVLVTTGGISAPASPFYVGSVAGQAGAVYQTAGTVVVPASGNLSLGSVAGAWGYYNLSGGAINIANAGEFDPAGNTGGAGTVGQFDMSGGTVNVGASGSGASYFLPCRQGVGEYSVVNVSGNAAFTILNGMTDGQFGGYECNWGTSSTNTTTLSGNATFTSLSESVKMNWNNNAGNIASLNLNGGTFQTLGFRADQNLGAVLNFNGGTLKAGNSDYSPFLANFANVYVYGGGATIHDNAHSITIAQPLLAPTGNGVGSIGVSGGAGYIVPPPVFITGGGGKGATAYAQISAAGAVTNIVVTCPGVGYTNAPSVALGAVGATSVASIGVISMVTNSVGSLTKTGTGTLTIGAGGGANFSGTTVNAGTLKVKAPVLYMSFDNYGGSTVNNDGSGGATLNGTLTGTAAIAAGQGRHGNALTITGTARNAGYVLINNGGPILNVQAGANWSVALWMKTTQTGSVYLYQGNGAWNNTGGADTVLYLGSGTPEVATNSTHVGAVSFGRAFEEGTAVINDGAWHYIVMTCNGTNKVNYVDGVVDSLQQNTLAGLAKGNQLWIGGCPTAVGDTGLSAMNGGLIDEVSFYNVALSQADVQLMMTNQMPVGMSAGPISVAASSTLDLGGVSPTATSLTGPGKVDTSLIGGNSILTISNDVDSIFNGVLANTAGSLSIISCGSGNLTFSGSNTYSGSTTITNGTLTISSSGSLGSYPGNIAMGDTAFTNSSSSVQTYAGVISGSGALVQNGSSKLVLSGANTYTGVTVVNSGTLAVYGALASSAVSLASNTVLLATNTSFAGSLTMDVGARIALTNGVAGGSLVVSNGLILNDGVVINLDLGAMADGLVVAGGGFTKNGTVTIRLTGLAGYAAGTNTLIQTSGGEIVSTNGFVLDSSGIIGAAVELIAEGGNLKLVTVLPTVSLWWRGDIDGLWNTVSGGTNNWNIDQTSGVRATSLPSAFTNIDFTANNAGNLNTTLGQDFEVNSLTFHTNSVTIGGANTLTVDAGIANLAGAGSNTINVATLALGFDQTWSNASVNALVVSASISGSNTITKTGSGALALSGASTFTGGTVLNEGTLAVNSAAALGNTTNGVLTVNGGVLDNTSGNPVTTMAAKAQTWAGDFTFAGTTNLNFNSGWVTIPGAGTRSVTLNSGVLTVGKLISTNASLALSGPGVLALTMVDTFPSVIAGTLNVGSGSTLRMNTGASVPTSSDVVASGLTGSGIVENGGGVERWLYITNSNNSAFSGVLRNGGGAGALGLNKNGTGTLTLTGSNPYGGRTTIVAGTLQIGDGATDGSITNSSDVSDAGTLMFTVANSNSYGHVIYGTGSLVKNGVGVLTLSGANSYSGSTTVNAGTLYVPAGGVANSSGTGGGNYFSVGTVSNVNSVLRVAGGAANLLTGSGDAWRSFMQIGNGAGCRGFANMTAGSVTAQRHLAVGNAGGFGAMTMAGGTVSVGSYFIVGWNGGYGVFNQSAGSVTQSQALGWGSTLIGSGTGGVGVMTLSGGSFTATAGGIFLSENSPCTGTLNILGNASVTAGNVGVRFGNDNVGSKGILNLMGGTLTANMVQRGNGTAIFNFHGGTLKPSASSSLFMQGLTAAYVYPEGAVIHDNSNTITMAQALVPPAGYGVSSITLTDNGSGYLDTPMVTMTGGSGSNATAIAQIDYVGGTVTNILVTNPGNGYGASDTLTATLTGGGGSGAALGTVFLAANTSGGLTKLGVGTLILSGSNTYSSATVVSNGTLEVDGSVASAVNVVSNAALAGTGAVYGVVTVVDGGTLAPGPVAINSYGALAIGPGASLGGALAINISSNGSCDRLVSATPLNFGAMALSVVETNLLTLDNTNDYVIATSATSVGSLFRTANLPKGWMVITKGGTEVHLKQGLAGFILIIQ